MAPRPAPPAFIEPQLATLVDQVPTAAGWIYEIKYDGYRTMVVADGKTVRCYSRNGLDWTHRFGAAPGAIAALKLRGAILDGEMAVVDPDGRTSFSALQDALSRGGVGIRFVAFDLLSHNGEDLRHLPLVDRKERLAALLEGAGAAVIYSAHIDRDGDKLLASLCRRRFEGIIAKRGDKPYRSGRGNDWVKVKCLQQQEFVVAGYTASDARLPFASLILAVNDKNGLRYAGHVGTGFTVTERQRLVNLFRPLALESSPLARQVPVPIRRKARWIKPGIVVQVAFTEFTADGMVRHPTYRGIREDKTVEEVTPERPAKRSAARRQPPRQ